MELTPARIKELLTDQYPRHIHDAEFATLQSNSVPDDPIILVLDETLWDHGNELGLSAHSMSADMARKLHTQLGATIDSLGDI